MGGGGGFEIGYGSFPVTDLETFLPSGFAFQNDHLILGGGGFSFRDRFVLGGSGYALNGNDINNDSLDISTSGGYGTFNFGYIIVDKAKFKLYPLIGIGGGGYSVSIAKRKNVTATEVAQDPGQEIEISNGGLIMDFSVNLNFLPLLNPDEDKRGYGGFMTGLKAGFLYQFPSSEWSFRGGSVTNSPDFGIRGFYVKLIIGGFGGN
jgi:opacity protein-like surface antigen